MKKLLILFIASFIVSFTASAQMLFWKWGSFDNGVTTDTTPPDSVDNLVALARAGANRYGYVDLTWDAVTDASMYYVYRGTSTNPTTLIDSTATNSYTDSLASNLYFYRVKAEDASYNLSSYSVNVSDTVYEFEFFRYRDALTTALSDSIKWKINTHIKNIKDDFSIDSLSQQFKVILYLANETSEAALKNLVERDNDATAVNSPTFTAHQGFTTNNTPARYINTNFNAGTADSTGFKRMSNSQGVYVRTDVAGTVADCGVNSSYVYSRPSNDTAYVRANRSQNIILPGATTSAGMIIATRTSHTSAFAYKNGDQIISSEQTGTSESLPNLPFVIGAFAYSLTPDLQHNSTRQYAYWFVGLGMNATQTNNFYDEVERSLDEDGAGVVASIYLKDSENNYLVTTNSEYLCPKTNP